MPSGDFLLIVWENKAGSYDAMGWICPICGRGLSPWVPECPHCQPSKSQGGVSTDKSHYPDTLGNGEKQYPPGYNPYGPNGFYDIGF